MINVRNVDINILNQYQRYFNMGKIKTDINICECDPKHTKLHPVLLDDKPCLICSDCTYIKYISSNTIMNYYETITDVIANLSCRVAVVGSKTFRNYELMRTVLNKYQIEEIVSGGAKGTDLLAEVYAYENHIPTKIFEANWKQFGKRAGYIRNKRIVDYCDFMIVFWDYLSVGTEHSINLAREIGKEVYIIGFEGYK